MSPAPGSGSSMNDEEIQFKPSKVKVVLQVAVILFLGWLLYVQAVTAVRITRQKRHWAAISRVADVIETLGQHKPAGISWSGWHGDRTTVQVCTANALYVLENDQLDALCDALENDMEKGVTLDTPRKWIEIMREHCPQKSDYFDKRLFCLGYPPKDEKDGVAK